MLNLDTCILLILLKDGLNEREKFLVQNEETLISLIVLWELWKLNDRGRIRFDRAGPVERALLSRMVVLPLDETVIDALARLDFRSDPADELIAATSLAHGIPLMTRDRKLRASKVVPLA